LSQTFLTLAMLVAVSIPLPAREPPSIKRLDRSTIMSAEVDETVSRLMKAAEVTGVGIAIFNDGKVAFSKAYGLPGQGAKSAAEGRLGSV
jgi:CubicO group peptidase (beta-lactamase class C family)